MHHSAPGPSAVVPCKGAPPTVLEGAAPRAHVRAAPETVLSVENSAPLANASSTRIIPIRRPVAPSAGEVRAELLGRVGAERTRVAVAVLFGAWEAGGTGPSPWDGSEVAPLCGLGPADVELGRATLIDAGVLRSAGDGDDSLEIRPDLLWELPSLAAFQPSTIRERLGVGRSLAAALALGWEIALRTSLERRESGIETTLESLAADTLYSRSSLKRAIQELEGAGLLARSAVPRGIRLRLLSPVWRASRDEVGSAPQSERRSGASSARTVVRVPGGGSVTLSGGTLDVGPGLRCVASLRDDGTIELDLQPE